ncbi:MAG: DUF6745 domain-containing protein [Nitrospirota bacterium]
MITELTEEQKKMIPVYANKWTKIGLSTEPLKGYEETINLFYEKILNKKRPTKIILFSSPLQISKLVMEQTGKQINKELRQQTEVQVWERVMGQVIEQIRKQISEQVIEQIIEQVAMKIRQVSQLRQLYSIEPYTKALLAGGYIAVYDYLNQVLDIQYPENWFVYKKIIELDLVYPFNDICIILDRPEQVSMKNGVLHNEAGMAIKYRDGWGVYYLNGVRVTKEIVETSADKLNPEIVLKETNAEVRREIVRKIGVERLEKKLKPLVLDKWGDYELHDYSHLFPNMRCKPVYLKMKNPSIGVWHYEGVNIEEMEAPTCQAALKWRLKGKDFKPIRIT